MQFHNAVSYTFHYLLDSLTIRLNCFKKPVQEPPLGTHHYHRSRTTLPSSFSVVPLFIPQAGQIVLSLTQWLEASEDELWAGGQQVDGLKSKLGI